MPLIVVCGLPLSGKSTRAEQLKKLFESEGLKAKVIAPANDGILSAVERHLMPNEHLIVDATNHSKSIRYQLYCVARNMSTTYCVVYSARSHSDVEQHNSTLQKYSPEDLQDAFNTFQEPDTSKRWDKPLFTFIFDDDDLSTSEYGRGILNYFASEGKLKPNLSTVMKPTSDVDYLQLLDSSIQMVISGLVNLEGDVLNITIADKEKLSIQWFMSKENINVAKLNRLKRTYLRMNNLNTVSDLRNGVLGFIEYLKLNL